MGAEGGGDFKQARAHGGRGVRDERRTLEEPPSPEPRRPPARGSHGSGFGIGFWGPILSTSLKQLDLAMPAPLHTLAAPSPGLCVLVLAVSIRSAPGATTVDPRLHHLRSGEEGEEREWSDFPEVAEGRELRIECSSGPMRLGRTPGFDGPPGPCNMGASAREGRERGASMMGQRRNLLRSPPRGRGVRRRAIWTRRSASPVLHRPGE